MNEHQEPRADAPSATAVAGPDPELAQLPMPRHPWRRMTVLSLLLCSVLSIALLFGLRGELAFSMIRQAPTPLGELAAPALRAQPVNQWVQATGQLSDHGGIRYQRPLEADSFRLVPLQGQPRIWVQVRVPAGYENEHFVPPANFVGRLLKVGNLGLRYSALREAITDAGWPKSQMADDSWILVDGESPSSIRWVMGLAAVLVLFCVFSIGAAAVVLRPTRAQ